MCTTVKKNPLTCSFTIEDFYNNIKLHMDDGARVSHKGRGARLFPLPSLRSLLVRPKTFFSKKFIKVEFYGFSL